MRGRIFFFVVFFFLGIFLPGCGDGEGPEQSVNTRGTSIYWPPLPPSGTPDTSCSSASNKEELITALKGLPEGYGPYTYLYTTFKDRFFDISTSRTKRRSVPLSITTLTYKINSARHHGSGIYHQIVFTEGGDRIYWTFNLCLPLIAQPTRIHKVK